MSSSRFIGVLKEYGEAAIMIHTTVFFTSFTGLYIAIKSNMNIESAFDKIRFKQLESDLQKIGMFGPKKELQLNTNQEMIKPRNRTAELVASNGGAFTLAFLCNGALMHVRVPITIALTHPIAKYVIRRMK